MNVSKIRKLSDFLRAFPVVTKLPLHWGEMDAFRHVNNVAYVRYQETARIVAFTAMIKKLKANDMSYGLDFLNARGIGPILSTTTVNYKYPLTYPDTILVGANILPSNIIDKQKMIQTHAIWSMSAGRIVAEGEGTLIAYDYATNKKAIQYPDCIIQAFADLSNENSEYMLPSLTQEFNLCDK